ncbi:MAG: S49 family peptidase [Candidatus Bathyarchaeia archaeon]
MEKVSHTDLRKMILAAAVACILLLAAAAYLHKLPIGLERELVAVLRIEGIVESSTDTKLYQDMIKYAITNVSIKAVVLQIDCPGGSADYIETIYLDLLELKKSKTLVASLVFAASGGYYIAVAADYLYVAPTSLVGNVGVIGVSPPIYIPSELGLETGAYKVTGFSKLLFPFNLSHALDSFVSAVQTGRGSRLRISSTQLARGMLYVGTEAVNIGLADEIGGLQEAIRKASERLSPSYQVVDLNEALGFRKEGNNTEQWKQEWSRMNLDTLNLLCPYPSIWYLYLSPLGHQYNLSLQNNMALPEQTKTINLCNEVLIDVSHGNTITIWELHTLEVELTKRNVTLRKILYKDELKEAILNATCLIVAAPTLSYSIDEVEEIKKLVDRGGLLLLFYDPTYEYTRTTLFEPMNSLSTHFGLVYGSGYLYNEREHYGLYRNIYVDVFDKSFITQNLSSIVFFTAAPIYPSNKGVAWTSEDTHLSTAERADSYAVIATVQSKGAVIAFGDMSFLRQPNCYVGDNYQLVLNIVSALAEYAKKGMNTIDN